MKLNTLIKKLTAMETTYGNVDVIIDHDNNGWYNTEAVTAVEDNDDGEITTFINIRSSNEV